MNKLRKSILWTILALFLPMAQAWAATTYYAALKAQVSSQSSGMGTVYAGTTQTAGSYDTASTSSADSENEGEEKTFYAFAKANDGYAFKGWSTSDNGTDLGTASPISQTVKCSSDSSDKPTTTTLYATFAQIVEYSVKFLPAVGGSYTVDGAAAADKTGLTEAYKPALKATPSAGYRLYGWYVQNGASKEYFAYTVDATYTALSDVQIGVDFIAESEVKTVTDFEGLQTALATSSPVVEIASSATVVIPAGKTLTVPAGKKLLVAGKLAVVGTLNVLGTVDGAGKVLKVTKIVTQGPVITPANTYTAYPSHRYRKTETADNAPALTGATPQCMVSYGVSVTGLGVFEMDSASPKILKVTFDTSVALNSIKSVTGSTDTTTASEPYLLLADANLNAPVVLESKKYNRLRYQSTLDCAGHKCTVSDYQVSSSFNGKFLNGTVEYTGEYWQQGDAWFYNCGSVVLKKLKGTGNEFHYYDCGSLDVPADVSFSYYNPTRSDNCRSASFYSGVYTYAFNKTDDENRCYVYGGSFKNDPTSYLENSAAPNGLEAPGPVDGYYTVYAKEPPLELVMIGDTAYPSLQTAITAAEPGAKLLLNGLNELSGTMTVPAGKQLTIDLNGYMLTGGTIVNEGALRFEDNSGQAEPGTLSSPVVNNGNGTIDIAYGTYAGTFTVNGGTLTTHEGTFTETFSAVENGGTVALKGGSYAAGAITVPEGYRIEGGKLGEVIRGDINPNNPIAVTHADFSYTVRGLPDDDSSWTLYSRFKHGTVARAAYTDAEWDRLSELRSAIGPIENQPFEATLVFDRPVAANSFSGVADIMGMIKSMPLDQDLAAGEEFHVLIPLIKAAGYTPVSYKYMFSGDDQDRWGTLLCGGKNHSIANIGTTCTLKFQLRIETRAPDYTTQNQHYLYSFYDIASQSYKFTGNGAIYGDTDYTSLQAALTAADYAETVLLSKDCAEQVTVSRATSFVLDLNNFAFTGSIVAGDGYVLTVENLGDGQTRYTVAPAAVAQVGGEKFTSLDDALAAAQTSGEPILVLGAVPETMPEGFMSIAVNGKTLLVPETEPEVVVQAPDKANFPDGAAATAKDKIVAAGPVAVITGTGVLDTDVCSDEAVLAALQAAATTEAERAQITAASKIRRYVSVQLTAVEVTAAAAFAGLSFDVKPMAKTFVIDAAGGVKVVVAQIPNDELKGGITFRLPLTDAFTASARIVHADDADRLVRVAQAADGKRYVTVTATHFSIFTVYPDSHVESALTTSNVLAVKRVPGVAGAAAGTEVVAAVPWRNVAVTGYVTVDRLVATGVATGDEIAAWMDGAKTYYTWRWNGTAWEPATDAKTGVTAPAASATTLRRGTAVWYKRANPSSAYSQVGGYDPATVTTAVTQGGATSEKKPANTLLINPFYEDVDLTKITGASGDQIQTLADKKVYTYKDGRWGTMQLVEMDSPFGTVKQQQFVAAEGSVVVPAGQGFWYISKGGAPAIDWKAIKAGAQEPAPGCRP